LKRSEKKKEKRRAAKREASRRQTEDPAKPLADTQQGSSTGVPTSTAEQKVVPQENTTSTNNGDPTVPQAPKDINNDDKPAKSGTGSAVSVSASESEEDEEPVKKVLPEEGKENNEKKQDETEKKAKHKKPKGSSKAAKHPSSPGRRPKASDKEQDVQAH